MKIASSKQILTALGSLVAEAARITGLRLTTEEAEFLRGKPVDAMLFFRDCHREWERRHVIPESTNTDPKCSFEVGCNRLLESTEAFIYSVKGGTDPLLSDNNLRGSMFSDIRNTTGFIPLKVMTLGREGFGFSDYVDNDVFLNNEFLARWSEKHYRGYRLELCDHFDIMRTCQSLFALLESGAIRKNASYIFATIPGKHTSQAQFLLVLNTYGEKPRIMCHSYHAKLTLVSEIVFRVVPIGR